MNGDHTAGVTNASFVFYRHKSYGDDLHKMKIEQLLSLEPGAFSDEAIINGIRYEDYFSINGASTFKLETTYPGLLVGSGYNHPNKSQIEGKSNRSGGDEKDEPHHHQLGFHFDTTTGMPLIPGSTVKGIIRSCLPAAGDNGESASAKAEYLVRVPDLVGLQDLKDGNKLNAKELIERPGDVFYDAYISRIPGGNHVFAEDYVTPHTKGAFKDPTPLRFLKIAAGVTFTFQFRVFDCRINDSVVVPAGTKLELFRNIILDFGVGAKRNVGYGTLVEALA